MLEWLWRRGRGDGGGSGGGGGGDAGGGAAAFCGRDLPEMMASFVDHVVDCAYTGVAPAAPDDLVRVRPVVVQNNPRVGSIECKSRGCGSRRCPFRSPPSLLASHLMKQNTLTHNHTFTRTLTRAGDAPAPARPPAARRAPRRHRGRPRRPAQGHARVQAGGPDGRRRGLVRGACGRGAGGRPAGQGGPGARGALLPGAPAAAGGRGRGGAARAQRQPRCGDALRSSACVVRCVAAGARRKLWRFLAKGGLVVCVCVRVSLIRLVAGPGVDSHPPPLQKKKQNKNPKIKHNTHVQRR